MDNNNAGPSRDDRGATATEYGLLVGFIAIAIVAGVSFFGDSLNDYFQGLGTWLTTVI
ncbi:pilus assembly protein Flp/PilA [Nocardioides alpinus]|uniref:Flp family type IVb pilin n=1 Tax=Nocardioides alpinus TaxID=748909 RepID=A0A1I0X5J3_9ACTN|nr:Flp family type IVb pilin [Nocardioides alpinus]PKH44107.1 Flp family type IVb pilin [Nocardioides alpinus]SFA95656.1 pilus assembly protein Flp/PilA [Nocardioides alpinus]